MKKEQQAGRQVLLRLGFVVYAAVMIWLLFGQRWGTEIYVENKASAINLKPFATLKMYWHILENSREPSLLSHAAVNLAGNVVMFIPLGVLVPCLFRGMRRFLKAMLLFLFLIITIETVQYFTFLGTCDVDDLILNMAGVLAGWLIWRFH